MQKCKNCGKEFLPSRKKVYCSHRCWYIAYHKDTKEVFDKECPICGSTFYTTDQRKIHCSSKCNETAQNRKRKTTKFEKRECPHCGTVFQPKQNRGHGKKYCSDKCKNAARYQRLKPQKSAQSRERDKRSKWDGNWWKALQRDDFTCQLCGLKSFPSQWKGKKRLMVHHKDGSGESGSKNHSLDNLTTLCQPCHNKFHHVHLIVEDGEYKVAGRIFDEIPLDQVKTTRMPK